MFYYYSLYNDKTTPDNCQLKIISQFTIRTYITEKEKNCLSMNFKTLRSNLFYLNRFNNIPPYSKITGANTKDTIVISLINIFIDGPEVSLKGSPTVSPTIPAT